MSAPDRKDIYYSERRVRRDAEIFSGEVGSLRSHSVQPPLIRAARSSSKRGKDSECKLRQSDSL